MPTKKISETRKQKAERKTGIIPAGGVYSMDAVADCFGRTRRNIRERVVETRIPCVDWGDGLILFSTRLFEEAIANASKPLEK